jgi:hypothetical protein
MVLKLGHLEKYIRNIRKVLKCSAGKNGEDKLDRSFKK